MITEPSTLVTDYAVAMLAAWLAVRLRSVARRRNQRSVALWAAAFVATAVGAFTGGTYHGFNTVLSSPAAAAIWTLTTLSVGVAAGAMLSAALMAAVRGSMRPWLLAAVWLQLAGYAAWMLYHDDFQYVIVEYGSAMILLLWLQVATPGARRSPAAPWMAGGVGVTIAAAAVQQSGFDVHRHLNHNDLQHLIQMAGLWLFYRGGATLTDARPVR